MNKTPPIAAGDSVYTLSFNRLVTDRLVVEVVRRHGIDLAVFEDGGTAPVEQCHRGALPAPSDFTVGQAVRIQAFGSWYPGVVVAVGRTRVRVRYTSGSGAERVKAANMGQVAS